MSLPDTPPTSSAYVIKKGDDGWPVYALQSALNSIRLAVNGGWSKLEEDGAFGEGTDDAVTVFQKGYGLMADGIAGPATQRQVIKLLDDMTHKQLPEIPTGLMRGFAEGEGGNLLAAVNWSVSGGVDCGPMQYRVYGPPYDLTRLKAAFDPYASFIKAGKEFLARAERFYTESGVRTRKDREEYSKRLAVLAHNWPYGAERLADGYALSNREAEWVPNGTKFPDGEPVNTYAEWAQYYAMGRGAWKGLIPRYVTDWS